MCDGAGGLVLRVLQVLPTLGYGGVARVVLNYRRQLEGRGFTFDFVTHGGVEDFHEELIRTGSRVFYLRPIHEVGIRRYVLSLREVQPASYDVVHIHTGHVTGVYALFLRILGQSNLVLHAHATVSVNPRHRIAMPLLRLLALTTARTRLACGVGAGDYCFGRGHYQVVPNGTDLAEIESVTDADVRRLRDELTLSSDDLVIGHIARFTPEKNQRFTLEVLECLRARRQHVRLVFAGDGPLRSQVEMLASTRGLRSDVLFLGNRSDVLVLMKCIDVVVLPSLFEGLPMTIVEAQASCRPSVVSDVVDRGVDVGLGLVEFAALGSAEEWAAAVIRAAESMSARQTCGEVRERIIQAGYDVSYASDLVAECYERVAGKSVTGRR